jgi:hypothetical protein
MVNSMQQKNAAIYKGLYIILIIILCLSPITLIHSTITLLLQRQGMDKPYQNCFLILNIKLQKNYLDAVAPLKNKVVLAGSNASPQLLFFSQAKTIGSNYTRNFAGMKDTIDFYTTKNSVTFNTIIKARRPDYIITCPSSNKKSFDKNLQINKFLKNIQHNNEWKEIEYKLPNYPIITALKIKPNEKPRIFENVHQP